MSQINKELEEYRKSLIEKILVLPGAACPREFIDFTLRGEDSYEVTWNETMLRDEGVPLQRLIDLHTIGKNKLAFLVKTY